MKGDFLMEKKQSDLKLWLTICAVILAVIAITGAIMFACGLNPFVMFEDFSGINGFWLIGLAFIIAAGFAALIIGLKRSSRKKTKWGIKKLLTGAMCVALSFVLSLIVLFRMPQGGSVTPACMLPIIVFSYIYGWQYGIAAGAILGVLNLLFDPYIIHPVQMILDYILGYAVIGLAGILRKQHIVLSVVIASVARWLCSVLSGVVFFAEYAGGKNVWLYSMGYNGTFMGIEAAICIVIVLIPPVTKMISMLKKQYSERNKA